MSIFDFLNVMAQLDINNANGAYQTLVFARTQSLAKFTGRDIRELTIAELQSCIAAASLDYNSMTPVRHGLLPLPTGAVMQNHQGALA